MTAMKVSSPRGETGAGLGEGTCSLSRFGRSRGKRFRLGRGQKSGLPMVPNPAGKIRRGRGFRLALSFTTVDEYG